MPEKHLFGSAAGWVGTRWPAGADLQGWLLSFRGGGEEQMGGKRQIAPTSENARGEHHQKQGRPPLT
ncbi:MAG: hypothetical protein QME70_09545 [Bacillota bacterium]|nr:hypothetical protein [Bacillota bacterium]